MKWGVLYLLLRFNGAVRFICLALLGIGTKLIGNLEITYVTHVERSCMVPGARSHNGSPEQKLWTFLFKMLILSPNLPPRRLLPGADAPLSIPHPQLRTCRYKLIIFKTMSFPKVSYVHKVMSHFFNMSPHLNQMAGNYILQGTHVEYVSRLIVFFYLNSHFNSW
jgi:hypothetical protein